MTPEEAIKTIKAAQAEVEWEYPLDYAAAFDVAIEALEKQIPIDPLDSELGICLRHPIIIPCENCGMELSAHVWKNCPYCGQKVGSE